jgi:flagellar assembly factor FliW
MTSTEPTLKFCTSRFGDIEIPEGKVIKVPDGIIGFPSYTRFALIDPSAGESLFIWLQSVENPSLAFILTDPLAIVPDYEIETSEPDIQRIDAVNKPAPALFVIVNVPPGDPDSINANLLAPLLYFESDNTLHQIVLEKKQWPLKYYILNRGEESKAGEVR